MRSARSLRGSCGSPAAIGKDVPEGYDPGAADVNTPALANRGELVVDLANRWGPPAWSASLLVRQAKAAARKASSPSLGGTRSDGTPVIRDIASEVGSLAPMETGKTYLGAAPEPKLSDGLAMDTAEVDPYATLTEVPRSGIPALDGVNSLIGGLTLIGGISAGGGARKPANLTAIQKSIARKAARQVALDKAKAREYRELQKRGAFPPPKDTPETSLGRKAFFVATEPFNASRSVITAFDLSAALRQGGIVSLSNPKAIPAAMADMFKSLATEAGAAKSDAAIRARPNAALYRQGGLFLAEGPGTALTAREEVWGSSLAEKVPGVKVSERCYNSYLNRIRADVFDSLVDSLCKGGPTPTSVELKAIGNYVNIATGRGDLGKISKAAGALSVVFFAPRLVASRFQFLAGQPMYGGTTRTRALVAEQYARYMMGLGVIYGLAEVAGGHTDFNPTSSDFGKIRWGDTRVDMLSGLGQSVVYLGRMLSGKFTTVGGKEHSIYGDVPANKLDALDVTGRFARSKLSPLYGNAVNMWMGETLTGDKVTNWSTARDMTVPLVARDVYEQMTNHDVPAGVAFSLASVFGAGVATYENKRKKAPRDWLAEERRSGSDQAESEASMKNRWSDVAREASLAVRRAKAAARRAMEGLLGKPEKTAKPKKGACYTCGEEGHYAKDCPNKAKAGDPKGPALAQDLVVDDKLTILAGTPEAQVVSILRQHKAGKFLDGRIRYDQWIRSLGAEAGRKKAESGVVEKPKAAKPKRVKKMTKAEKARHGSVILTNRWGPPAWAASLAVRRAKAAARKAAALGGTYADGQQIIKDTAALSAGQPVWWR